MLSQAQKTGGKRKKKGVVLKNVMFMYRHGTWHPLVRRNIIILDVQEDEGTAHP